MNKHHGFNLVLIANNKKSLEKGLMYTDPLKDDEAAIFIFPYSDYHSFWNKNVDYNLTLAFVNENYKIVDILDMKAQSLKSTIPKHTCKYVIELKQGILSKLNIKEGDNVIFNNNKLFFNSSGN